MGAGDHGIRGTVSVLSHDRGGTFRRSAISYGIVEQGNPAVPCSYKPGQGRGRDAVPVHRVTPVYDTHFVFTLQVQRQCNSVMF